MRILDWIIPFFLLLVVLAMVTCMICLDEVVCLVKNHTLNVPPPGYEILTNGKSFTYRIIGEDGDFVSRFRIHASKTKAVIKAWDDYDESLKNSNSWHPLTVATIPITNKQREQPEQRPLEKPE